MEIKSIIIYCLENKKCECRLHNQALVGTWTDKTVEYVISMTNFEWPNEPTVFFCRRTPPAVFPVSESVPILYAGQRSGCIRDSGLVLGAGYTPPPPCLSPVQASVPHLDASHPRSLVSSFLFLPPSDSFSMQKPEGPF